MYSIEARWAGFLIGEQTRVSSLEEAAIVLEEIEKAFEAKQIIFQHYGKEVQLKVLCVDVFYIEEVGSKTGDKEIERRIVNQIDYKE